MTVISQRIGKVLVIRIQREHRRNAIDEDTTLALSQAFDLLDQDSDLRVGILTGTKTVFCAGTDLTCSATPRTDHGGEYGLTRRQRVTPLIAAVEGYAVGGGFELALACDLIVASTSANFGMPEVRRGLVPSAGGLVRTNTALPTKIAVDLLLTGSMLPAERAFDLGLVARLTRPGEALDVALTVAEDIVKGSPYAISRALQVLQEIGKTNEQLGWAASDAVTRDVRASADAREGIAAFLEKREPEWVGH